MTQAPPWNATGTLREFGRVVRLPASFLGSAPLQGSRTISADLSGTLRPTGRLSEQQRACEARSVPGRDGSRGLQMPVPRQSWRMFDTVYVERSPDGLLQVSSRRPATQVAAETS